VKKKIIELLNNKLNRVWYINQLKNARSPAIGDSFQRTKKWLEANHPELLL
jgi:hypothetical protein